MIEIREKVGFQQIQPRNGVFFQISCGFRAKPLVLLDFSIDALSNERYPVYGDPSPCI